MYRKLKGYIKEGTENIKDISYILFADNTNNISIWDFIFYAVFGCYLIFMYWGGWICSRVYNYDLNIGLDYENMRSIYIVTGIFNVIMLFILPKRRLNYKNCISCVLFPGVVCISIRLFIINIYLLMGVAAVILVYGILSFIRAGQFSKIRKNKKIYMYGAKRAYDGMAKILMLCAAVFLCYTYLDNIVNIKMVQSKSPAVETGDEDELWERNKDNFYVFTEYESMSQGEKMKVLQFLCDYEAEYLGCERTEIELKTFEPDKMGEYSLRTGKIYLDKGQLSDLYTAIETTAHEIFHVYEYECGVNTDLRGLDENLYVYRHIKKWKEEFLEYENGTGDNFEDYYDQYCERDSRAYGKARAEWYMGEFEKMKKDGEVTY